MSYNIFYVAHLTCLFLFVGIAFAAFAAPAAENRKRILAFSGITSLLVFVSGFGLLGVLKIGFPVWIIVKLVCWIALAVLTGLAFRKPEKMKLLVTSAIVIIGVAVVMVTLKPFAGI